MRGFVVTLGILSVMSATALAQSTDNQPETEEELDLQPLGVSIPTRMVLELGERAVVHALRGVCGELPPVTDLAETQTTKLGHLILGRAGLISVPDCADPTPAYEVIYVPQRRGRETLNIFGSKIRLRVKRNSDTD